MLSIYDNFNDKPSVRSRTSTNPILSTSHQFGLGIQVHTGTSNPWTLGPNTRQAAGGMDLNDIPRGSLHAVVLLVLFLNDVPGKFHDLPIIFVFQMYFRIFQVGELLF